MARELWPRRQETFPRPRKPTALCPVDGPRFAWVPSARAGRHSREEESSLPVRPWSAMDPVPQVYPAYPGKANAKALGRAFNGQLADHHQFLCAHTFGRIDSIDTDIARHRRADRGAFGPFLVEDDPGHQDPHRRRLGRSADTPGARAGAVLNQKKRSQPTPVAVARCGTNI